MAPWWIRPTSDEAEQEENSKGREAQEPKAAVAEEVTPEAVPAPLAQERQADSVVAEPAAESSANAGPAEEGSSEGGDDEERAPSSRSRSRRGGRRSRRGPRSPEPEASEASARREVEPKPAPVQLIVAKEPSLEVILREIFLESPQRTASDEDESKIALFCDFENIALGVRQSHNKKFEISLVLERLLEKGKVIVKKAYSDWSRYSDYKKTFHEAGIELIEIPQKYYSGKNSADIKMVVDAMELCYTNDHIDTFVILSGDSDFSPLVSKLKENNKYVIGLGVKDASSNLLIDNCDEFIYYEDLWRDAQTAPLMAGLEDKDAEVFGLMTDAMQALIRENKEILWGSMVKQTMKRKKPSFNEGYYGYRTFSELLEDAEDKGIVALRKDKRSGSYIVKGFGSPERDRVRDRDQED